MMRWPALLCLAMLSLSAQADISDDVRKAFLQTAGEIGKETQAFRSIAEALQTWDLQQALAKDAQQAQEKMTRKENACVDTMLAEQTQSSIANVQEYGVARANDWIAMRNDANTDMHSYLMNRNEQSLALYCSSWDEAVGRCKRVDTKIPGGDIVATTLFMSEGSGEGATEGYVQGQREAAEAFAERIAGVHFVSSPMPSLCSTPQCGAFEELRKRMLAIESVVRFTFASSIGRRTSANDFGDTIETADRGLAGSVTEGQ